MNFEIYQDREALMMRLADQIASQLGQALRARGKAVLSVPGGTTPGPVFDLLSEVDLDWGSVYVMLNDERWVDESSERSNTALLRRRLLRGKARAAHLVPLYAPADQPEDQLEALSKGIEPHLPIDVLLLGMGADMHTASLFPEADQLAQALADDAPVLMALRSEAAGEPRITLTARVLKDAMNTHVLIIGQQKRDALERAKTLTPMEAPVACILPHATVHWAE
ncbi:6-phosphogluconolactonase [Albirhodobacter sp. R86504]|jgi:6-phosphogluconolactonase|uniref:6-phosphogluconolactonase n=1 Tax=Albirhodobacter sp. R86504 TaxID=3093848 RepID=UPI00366CFDA1